MKLAIADNVKLPLESVTQTFATLAKRGVGKSYLAAVMAEEMLKAGQAVVIIDPTGAHWGLRSSANGKQPGYPIVVIGGDHADVPLEEHAGEVVAAAIVEHRFPAILDLSLLRKGESLRFMWAFLETLYRLNREALHLIVDEADTFAPQRLQADEARVCGAMEDVVKKGRIRGLGCTLITQRPAVLNKNVLTQCETLFAMRMTHPKDIDAIKEWVGVHSDPSEAEEVIKSLPSLEVGTAWLWSPGWLQMLKKIHVRRRETFDSSATPKPGERKIEPKRLASIDLAQLGAQIQTAAEQAKANDPKELRRQVAELQKQLATKQAAPPAKIERVEVPILTEKDQQRIGKAAETVAGALARVEAILDTGKVGEALETLRAMNSKIHGFTESVNLSQHAQNGHSAKVFPPFNSPKQAGVSPERPVHSGGKIIPTIIPAAQNGEEFGRPGGALRKIMVALAQHPEGLSYREIGAFAGVSTKGGSFSTYLSRARAAGWIVGNDAEKVRITHEGFAALGSYEPLPRGQALRDYWINQVGGKAADILRAVFHVYPDSLSDAEIGELADVSIKGGSYSTYLSRLRAKNLISKGKPIRAMDYLFEE